MQIVQFHHFAAQLYITVHQRKLLMDRLDQVVIYGKRDCICIQRCFPCILVSSLLCKKVCLLRIGLIHGGNGIFILRIRRIQSLKC